MELSRLSNSLGSVCSQRRGLAGSCSGPSPAPSLFQPSLPSISLPLESLEHFPPVHAFPPAANPAGLLCLLVLNAAPGSPLTRAQLPRGPRSQTPSLAVGCLACSPFSLRHPPINPLPQLEGCCGMKPSKPGHCFTSCPVLHPPQRSCLTGPGPNKRFWSLTNILLANFRSDINF